MQYYDMAKLKVLQAATLYYHWVRYAQDITTTGLESDAVKELNELATKLFSQKPIANPTKDNLKVPNEGLIATLFQEVNAMELRDNYPISRPEAKAAVRTMVNDGRQFYTDLSNSEDIDTLISEFQKIINEWTSFKTSYLSGDFLNQMELDGNSVGDDLKDDYQQRLMFWKEFIQITDATISQVYQMLQDQATGNSETELEAEPL